MNNSRQNRKRTPQPKLKKTWQRITFIWVPGVILSFFVQWTLFKYDPNTMVVTNKRLALIKLMLTIASPRVWLWTFLCIWILNGILSEFYIRGYWPYTFNLAEVFRRLRR